MKRHGRAASAASHGDLGSRVTKDSWVGFQIATEESGLSGKPIDENLSSYH